MLHLIQTVLMEREYFGVSLANWLAGIGTLLGVYLGLTLVRRFIERRFVVLAKRTANPYDDYVAELIRRTRWFFLLLIGVWAATRFVPPSDQAETVLRAASVILVLWQVGIWGNGLIGVAIQHYLDSHEAGAGMRTTVQALGYAGRFALWSLLFVTALQNFGIQVTALITGLGVGGIAIALAVQNILGDLFAALAIMLDKPFVVGDFIIVDNVLGSVEHIGLKTTRLRSLGGEQIIVSNADLLKSRIRNYKRMEQRRIVFHVDVTYDTAPEMLNRIPTIIRDAIESQPQTRFDRSHFMTFADSSLRVETVYFVLSPDYNKYADTQHAINVEIVKRFNADGIDFAFPSRTLYLRGPDGDELPVETLTRSPYADQ